MAKRPGRGWSAVAALALAAAILSAASPILLIFIPLALQLLALSPRRPGRILVGAALLGLAFWGMPGEALAYAERGWALVLGGWFVAFAVFWPKATFLSRALAAVTGSLATASVVLAVTDGWAYLDWTVSRQFHGAASTMASLWGAAAQAEPVAAQLADGLYRAAELQALLHPALLALASIAALGVAWWAQERMSGRAARGLAPFREFRFRDELVWLLIIGILLVVIPAGQPALRAGSNLIAFMGTLYMLRGTAVVLAVTGVPALGAVILGLLALLILPMVMPAAAMVGLADTWIDLRARRSVAGSGS